MRELCAASISTGETVYPLESVHVQWHVHTGGSLLSRPSKNYDNSPAISAEAENVDSTCFASFWD